MPVPGVPHLMSLADLTAPQLKRLIQQAHVLKHVSQPWLAPSAPGANPHRDLRMPSQSLFNKHVALLFSKRSTRTRVAAETAAGILGGRALFLGRDDIQLGVNESARDTARVIGGMCEGIFARVGEHSEIEELVEHSPVPVLNALSSLWHPTQILADLLTLHEHAAVLGSNAVAAATAEADAADAADDAGGKKKANGNGKKAKKQPKPDELPDLPKGLTVAWVGDSTNILHDMLVAYPRLGMKVRVATPAPAAYQCPTPVWERVQALGCDKDIVWTSDPREAVHGADVVVTDTWISMGQEAEKAQRLKDFRGYQVTEALCAEGGANPHWKFLHCLPRKPDEVDDDVFYGPRSLAFPEADNRKWTIMACFDLLFGKWDITGEREEARRIELAMKKKKA